MAVCVFLVSYFAVIGLIIDPFLLFNLWIFASFISFFLFFGYCIYWIHTWEFLLHLFLFFFFLVIVFIGSIHGRVLSTIFRMMMAEYCPRFSELRIAHLGDKVLKKSNESWFAEIIITHWSVHMDFIPQSKKQTTNPLNYRLSLINVVTSVRTAPPPLSRFFAILVITYLEYVMGGPLINVFLRVYFDFFFFELFYWFWVFCIFIIWFL